MIYVIDTNVFSRTFKNVSLDVFDDIWEPWANLMASGKAISVDEVFYELQAYWGDKPPEMKWLKKYRDSFQKLTNEEGLILREIFKDKKFREGVKEKSLRSGSPEADALLVAKAKSIGGIVVTAESDNKPHSEKIPNICVAFGVPYMIVNDFYKMLKNIHQGKNPLLNVSICYELGNPMPSKIGVES
jgi:hypothetical protein